MAKKRKIRPDRILIIVLAVVLLVLLVMLGIKYLFNGKQDNNENKPNNNETVDVKSDLEILNYDVYNKIDELGFGFAVAEIQNNSDGQLDLSNFSTNEHIVLSEVFNYEKKLKTSSYDFDSLNTTLDLNGEKCRIFIPFVDVKDNLIVTDKNSNYSYTFDLSKNNKDISVIKKETNEEIIISEDYTFSCDKPYIESMMKHNDEPYDSSMLSVYCFRLTCDSIKNGVKITDAKFVDKAGNITEAYDSTYSSSKIANILNRDIKVGDTYALFFELYSNNEDHVAYEGTIKLSFSDGSSAEVSTILN